MTIREMMSFAYKKKVEKDRERNNSLDLGFSSILLTFFIWIKALRVHQWSKNLLIFVPAFFSQSIFKIDVLNKLAIAFLSWSLLSSAVYIVNDLVDRKLDQKHPQKKHRPFSSGQLTIWDGVLAAILLSFFAVTLSFSLSYHFQISLLCYAVLTTLYSFWLKSISLVDVFILAALYSLRIISGGVASGVMVSYWLTLLSIFLFFGLAVMKRVADLNMVKENPRNLFPSGRDYSIKDFFLLEIFGVTSSYFSVLILALYLNGQTVKLIYSHPQYLWIAVFLLMFWLSRMWLQAHRGFMHSDPVIYTLRDWPSYVIACFTIFIFIIAR